MKKIFGFLLLISFLPMLSSCNDNDLAGTEWLSADGEQTLIFKTNVGGYYYYIAYAGITGERTECMSEFTYRYDGESEGEMHVQNYITGCIIGSYFWNFTLTGDELHLIYGSSDKVFVRKQ